MFPLTYWKSSETHDCSKGFSFSRVYSVSRTLWRYVLHIFLSLLAAFVFYKYCWSSFLFYFFLWQLCPLFLTSSSTWINHLVLCHPIDLFPLDFISNALYGIITLSVTFMYTNNCYFFFSNSVKSLNSIFSKTFIYNSVSFSVISLPKKLKHIYLLHILESLYMNFAYVSLAKCFMLVLVSD